jgi:hypothetical protein
VRVFNLTDVTTPVLKQRGLVRMHFAVARRMVNPGEYADIGDAPGVLADLQFLLQVGAVSVDRVPPTYAIAKQRELQADPSRLSGIPAKHIAMKETLSAGVAAPRQMPAGDTVVLQRYDVLSEVSDVEDTSVAPTVDPVTPPVVPVATSTAQPKVKHKKNRR